MMVRSPVGVGAHKVASALLVDIDSPVAAKVELALLQHFSQHNRDFGDIKGDAVCIQRM